MNIEEYVSNWALQFNPEFEIMAYDLGSNIVDTIINKTNSTDKLVNNIINQLKTYPKSLQNIVDFSQSNQTFLVQQVYLLVNNYI